jgi:hypothetical protein
MADFEDDILMGEGYGAYDDDLEEDQGSVPFSANCLELAFLC